MAPHSPNFAGTERGTRQCHSLASEMTPAGVVAVAAAPCMAVVAAAVALARTTEQRQY